MINHNVSVTQSDWVLKPFTKTLRVSRGGFEWGDVSECYYLMGQSLEGGFALEPTMRTIPNQNVNPDSGPYLLERKSEEYETFEPMSLVRLHRKFAKLEPSPDQALSFATKYGFLGRRVFVGRTAKADHVRFEELDFWLTQIVRMKLLVLLADLLTNANQSVDSDSKLAKMIDTLASHGCCLQEEWVQKNPVFTRFLEAFPNSTALTLAAHNLGSEQRSRSQPKEWNDLPQEERSRRLARALVIEHLNIEILHSVTPVYTSGERPKLMLMPLNLLGAMYLHLARALTSDTLTTCDGCGKVIVGARLNQRYCGQPCKQRALRRRRSLS